MDEDPMGLRELDERNIATEAAEWLFRLQEDPDLRSNAEFAAWLKRSPRHMGEFLFATASFELLRSAKGDCSIDLNELERLPDNVASFSPTREPVTEASSCGPGRLFSARRVAIAAMVILGLGCGLALLMRTYSSGNLYRTGVGEQRSFKLDDGSVLYLNTQSSVRVAYSNAKREVNLIGGEALFSVARDRTRPFRVRSGAAEVEAVGTEFNVYYHNGATTVSVIEGRVNVAAAPAIPERASAADSSAGSVTPLAAGEEAQVSGGGRVSKHSPPNLTRTLAWRQRRLMFDGTPLSRVAQEFNRYNRAQIFMEGAEVGARQITGTFNADEPHALVNFLRDDASLDIRESGEGVTIAARK